MSRIMFLVLTNIGVTITLLVVASLLGVPSYLSPYGIDLGGLAVFALFWGFGGAYLSLLMSKPLAKWTMKVKLLNGTENGESAWLVGSVRALAEKRGLRCPEVGIYHGAPNAFATGAFKNSALVAVSDGLLNSMSREEVRAVLAHEIEHVANGDMQSQTLLQGCVNAFAIFLSRILSFAIVTALRKGEEEEGGAGLQFVLNFVFDLVFSFLGAMVVAYHSRKREFAADAGAARLVGAQPMMHALARLSGKENELSPSMKAMGISGAPGGFLSLFATHPPIENRIEALRNMR